MYDSMFAIRLRGIPGAIPNRTRRPDKKSMGTVISGEGSFASFNLSGSCPRNADCNILKAYRKAPTLAMNARGAMKTNFLSIAAS